MQRARQAKPGKLLDRGVWIMPYRLRGQRVLAAISRQHEMLAEWPVASPAEEARAGRELWTLLNAADPADAPVLQLVSSTHATPSRLRSTG